MNELPLLAFEHAIQAMHAARSRLLTRERVVEEFRGETVWEGDVLVFELIDHPTAKKCYAWSVDGKITVVLGEGPINGALSAVRAAVVSSAH